MGNSQRRRQTGSEHSVGLQILLDPAPGVQEAEEEHRGDRKRVIHRIGEVLQRSRASYEVGSSSELNSKHKIFLSYSRCQLDFVKKVCEDLEDRHRFPFLDIRHSSLPLGERFAEPLSKAAQQCWLAVVVVSEEYLTSEWPMRELVEFMRAKSGSNPNLKILPLFYKLCVWDLGDESNQKRWFEKWAEWAEADPSRVDVAEYKEAFAKVKEFNGIQFNRDIMDPGSYEKQVVGGICDLVSPDIKLYDGHVQGISNMYEDYMDKIQGIQPCGRFGVRVIGYYGMGGIGKTTMCETLCNELSWEFEDKVCHVQLPPRPSSSEKLLHLKEVLKKLTSTSDELLQELNEGQCKDILCKRVSWKQKAFLALDNVWENTSLIEYVRMFLRNAAFHDGSVVMVTARCLKTLEHLGLDSAQCFEVPELSEDNARNLFLLHAMDGRPIDGEDDTKMIDMCIARCYFQKGRNQGSHFLPLALKVLGIHLGGLGNTPGEWLDNLPKVRDFSLHYPEDNPVYSVIRLNYDWLSREDQELFLDIMVYLPQKNLRVSIILWLSHVHCKSLEAIQNQMQRLKEKGLLEDLDYTTGDFSMHDLYHEFAVWELQGKSKCEGLENSRWMYESGSYSSILESMPQSGIWQSLIRVLIVDERPLLKPGEVDGNLSFQGIQWRYFSNVVVLNLHGLANVKGVLNLKDLYRLRSLYLFGLYELDGVEGLQDLKYLSYFLWDSKYLPTMHEKVHPVGQLPASLKVLQVYMFGSNRAKFGIDTFSRCTNLCNLKLRSVEASDGIGLDQCTSLESLELTRVRGPGFLASEELLDLHKFTRLQVLRIEWSTSKVCGLNNLGQLRELLLDELREPPNLLGLQNLHHLALLWCSLGRTVDFGMAGLPLLQHLDLQGSSLVELPNLSKMTALEELKIGGTFIELQEEDIIILAKLPRLHPPHLGIGSKIVMLDVVRRKVMHKSDFEMEEGKESDLGILPIRVREFSPYYFHLIFPGEKFN